MPRERIEGCVQFLFREIHRDVGTSRPTQHHLPNPAFIVWKYLAFVMLYTNDLRETPTDPVMMLIDNTVKIVGTCSI